MNRFRTVGGVLLLFLFVGGMIALFFRGDLYVASPTQVREWNRETFERYIIPSRFAGAPMPDLSTRGAIPDFTIVEKNGGAVDVTYSHNGEEQIPKEIYTVIQADQNLKATLENGEKLRVAALALTFPEEGTSLEAKQRRKTRKDPNWLNPVTREPQEKLPWQRDRVSTFGSPALHVSLEKGSLSPHVMGSPEIFDATTMAPVIYRQSMWHSKHYGLFDFQLQTWHATDLLLVVPILYGDPETAEIALEKGGRVVFDDKISVTNVVELSGHYWPNGSSGSYGDGLASYKSSYVPGNESTATSSKYTGLFTWPVWAGEGIEFYDPANEEWRSMKSYSGGLTMIATDQSQSSIEKPTLTLRRFPHFAKVVFRIEALPGFPESKNLFTTPIKKVVITDDYDFFRAISMAVQAESKIRKNQTALDHIQWPLVFENTTPLELLREFEREAKMPLYFDDKTFVLTPEFPEPFWSPWIEKVEDWWKGISP